ncbi:hypothetical protein V8E52_008440 [Russula decolorans]
MISHILANLTATYTNMCVSINTDSSKWVFNNAGGVMARHSVRRATLAFTPKTYAFITVTSI